MKFLTIFIFFIKLASFSTAFRILKSETFHFHVPKSHNDFIFNESTFIEKSSMKLQFTSAQRAAERQFPFVCEIRILLTSGDGFICTGSLIAKDWVLSARHCIEDKQNATVQILLGSADRTAERVAYFADKSFSPLISDDFKPDLVLIHLTNSVSFTEDIEPIKLISPIKAYAVIEGSQMVTLAGWGQISPDKFSRYLQYTEFKLVAKNELDLGPFCYASKPINRKSQSLGGDSGGPMFIVNKGIPIQIGVNVAYIILQTSKIVYQQSIMISKFLPFIASHVGSI